MTCRICNSNDLDEPISLREMMFGTREQFEYFRCRSCDTLQIAEIPLSMAEHYPAEYYSFGGTPGWKERVKLRLKPPPRDDWAVGIPATASVLDIGCGSGQTMIAMHRWGFRKLRGFDPFLASPISYSNGIEIDNSSPNGSFDVVMMHHALEHVADPRQSLQDARELLNPGGKIVIRIPVRQGKPWRDFGLNWAHLDPPRHFHLWTVAGFESFARDCGLTVESMGFDANVFSLAGSALNAQDIPLQNGARSNLNLTAEEITTLNAEIAHLNQIGDSDAAWFVLSPS